MLLLFIKQDSHFLLRNHITTIGILIILLVSLVNNRWWDILGILFTIIFLGLFFHKYFFNPHARRLLLRDFLVTIQGKNLFFWLLLLTIFAWRQRHFNWRDNFTRLVPPLFKILWKLLQCFFNEFLQFFIFLLSCVDFFIGFW